MNDTHPSIAVAELMRLLVDDHGLDWDQAWTITQETCAYTNHTLLSEALEKWPLPLFASLLPRHLEIIFEINQRFLDDVRRRCPGDDALIRRLSIIDEAGDKSVRMAHLASAGSHAINGVAALHTELLKETVLRDFHAVYPQRIVNVTNGVTPRRWIALSNPELSALISDRIGDRWLWNLEEELIRLEPLAGDAGFQAAWRAVKAGNKRRLAGVIKERVGIEVNPESLFDIQVKRLHEYKRQHLNVLYLVAEYLRLKEGGVAGPPRTVIFGGKAAPGYRMAKLIVRLIHGVAGVINADPADLAGPEGRLHPRLQREERPPHLSGRRPVGTDLHRRQGSVGHREHEVRDERRAHDRHPGRRERGDSRRGRARELLPVRADRPGSRRSEGGLATGRGTSTRRIAVLRATLDLIASGAFANGDRDLFRPLVDSLSRATTTCCWPTFSRTWTARHGSARRTATRRPGRGCPSSTARGSADSRRIGRSGTTAATSGTSSRITIGEG